MNPHVTASMRMHYPLNKVELWWRDHQEWIESCGYLLRPRYRVGWERPTNREETMRSTSWVMDATRLADGVVVALKLISLDDLTVSGEERIMLLLNSEPLASHPDNPCPKLYDILTVPGDDNQKLLVLPFLRRFDSPPFETVGEVMDFCRQALHGLRFLHEHDIAHRDPHYMNIMLDPTSMYPNGFYTGHPSYDCYAADLSIRAQVFTRTQRPSRYYWIDYGLADVFRSDRADLRVPYVRGGDKDIPETRKGLTRADPFAADVWWVGNLIQTQLLERYSGLESLAPLVASMCRESPEDRPTMVAATVHFDKILMQCSSWRLRSLTVRRKHLLARFLQGLPPYILHTVSYLLTRKPALPSARSV
ncbi:hypothetical protein C8F04DRAFT_1221938 [Mycena alexandri]|uniref:Protein kinase domain-containing protein n=1 Tax=Mycena alexandri TaxID=1745969 RepID=A0AAD6X2E1_9AGAR|nr:hypothetical protein C8F04DRAFT_1221938 [Mycena alexandri]